MFVVSLHCTYVDVVVVGMQQTPFPLIMLPSLASLAPAGSGRGAYCNSLGIPMLATYVPPPPSPFRPILGSTLPHRAVRRDGSSGKMEVTGRGVAGPGRAGRAGPGGVDSVAHDAATNWK